MNIHIYKNTIACRPLKHECITLWRRNHVFRISVLVTSLKMLQSDWLMKCKNILIMTLRGAKTIFLDT